MVYEHMCVALNTALTYLNFIISNTSTCPFISTAYALNIVNGSYVICVNIKINPLRIFKVGI